MCILAKYEPASDIGTYEWDYKLSNNYPVLNNINRYLVELEDLNEFINKYKNYYYAIAPLWGWNKIQRKLREREFQKDNWSRIDFCKIEEEQREQYKHLEDRLTIYYAKQLNNYCDYSMISKNYWDWRNLYIIVSRQELNSNQINNIFSQLSYFNSSNSMFDYLVLQDIGFIYLHPTFFHEEYSHSDKRQENGEKILIYYCPWRLVE